MRQAVERGLLCPPVKFGPPVCDQLLDIGQIRAIVPCRARDLLGPAGTGEALTQVHQHLVWNVDGERVHGHYDVLLSRMALVLSRRRLGTSSGSTAHRPDMPSSRLPWPTRGIHCVIIPADGVGSWLLPSTATCGTSTAQCRWRWSRLTGSLSQKRQQFSIDLLGCLPLEKVPIMPQMFRPGLGEYWPPDVLQWARTHGFSRPYPPGAKQEQERRRQLPVSIRLPLRWLFIRRGAVVVEAASERPRLGVRLNVLRHLLVADRVLIHGPIPENMPQIDLLAPFDQLFRQIILLMEVGVPALTDNLWHLWPIALVRGCGIEQRQPCDRLFVVDGEAVGDSGADVMSHKRHPLVS